MISDYSNFVKQSEFEFVNLNEALTGEEARKLYLAEVNGAKCIVQSKALNDQCTGNISKTKSKVVSITDKQLFELVQNNEIEQLKCVLDNFPERINTLDEYGWSLLMIACQANAVDVFTELLKRGISTSVRDKAGNSAHTLIIKNKNLILCDILLNYKSESKSKKSRDKPDNLKINVNKQNENFFCERCNKTFSDKEEHLSSTLHNISASEGKTILPSYVIPSSNKGFQIMLKTGWDRAKGLGPVGSGKIYPIKTVLKQDRKGLGLEKRKPEQDTKHKMKEKIQSKYKDRRMEVNFRREFY